MQGTQGEAIRKLRLTARRLIHTQGEGSFRTFFYGRGIEFATLREYVPGDDIRQIEWNTTARRGTPYVKSFVEERDLSILLVVDLSSSMETKKNALLSVSALITTLADFHDDRVGGLGFTDQVEFFEPPRKNPMQPEKLLHQIMMPRRANRKTSLPNALSFLQRVLKKKSILFVISDFLDREYEHRLMLLSRKHEIVGIYLYDSISAQLPEGFVLDALDPESGNRRLVDSYDTKVRGEHAAYFQKHKQGLMRAFAGARADFCMLEAERRPDLKMIEFLRKRQASQAPIFFT